MVGKPCLCCGAMFFGKSAQADYCLQCSNHIRLKLNVKYSKINWLKEKVKRLETEVKVCKKDVYRYKQYYDKHVQ